MKCPNCKSHNYQKRGTRRNSRRYACGDCNRWWSAPISENSLAIDRGVAKRLIVTPDKHVPIADDRAMSVVAQAIEIIKPDCYIDLGDILEGEAVSHWQWKAKKKPPLEYIVPRIDKELEKANAQIDIIDEALDKVNIKEKHLTIGNHDDWYDKFVEEYPYLPRYAFKNAINNDKRGYTLHPMGKLLKIGKLHFYHGHLYAGLYHTANHLRKFGCNVMYGHHHDIQQNSVTHVDGVKSAWSIGCLKDMSSEANKWLKNRQHNWAHCFAIVDFYNGDYFTVHTVVIVDGMTSLWGEIIEG